MLKSRIIVAAVLLPIVVGATLLEWQNSVVFALIVGIAGLIATSELYHMTRPQKPYVPVGLIATAVSVLACWQAGPSGVIIALVVSIPLTLLFSVISVRRADPVTAIAVTLLPVLYISVACGLLVALRGSKEGLGLVFLIFVATWATDIAAYFGGRAFGRHKLAPRLSPGKTIEGFVFGTVAGTAVTWWGHFLTQTDSGYWLGGVEALILGVLLSTGTAVGDLFESLLKRSSGTKDSSHLLGGHGGMLDRIDALLVTVPVAWVAAYQLQVL